MALEQVEMNLKIDFTLQQCNKIRSYARSNMHNKLWTLREDESRKAILIAEMTQEFIKKRKF